MDLTKFLALLEGASLFFCRADLFQDAFEGSLAQANVERREQLGPIDPADEAYIEIPYKKMREWTAINCWNCSGHESAAMWSMYCPDGPGLAIRTTFARLCEALKECQRWKVSISKVTYLDYQCTAIPDGHLLAPFLHKRQSFEHEQEVRAIIQRMPDATLPDRVSPFAGTGGTYAKVDLQILLEAIYVSPVAPSWYFDLVQRLVSRYGIAVNVHQSGLAGDPIY